MKWRGRWSGARVRGRHLALLYKMLAVKRPSVPGPPPPAAPQGQVSRATLRALVVLWGRGIGGGVLQTPWLLSGASGVERQSPCEY